MNPLPIEIESAVIKYAAEHYGAGATPPAGTAGPLRVNVPQKEYAPGIYSEQWDVTSFPINYATYTVGFPELYQIIAGLSAELDNRLHSRPLGMYADEFCCAGKWQPKKETPKPRIVSAARKVEIEVE